MTSNAVDQRPVALPKHVGQATAVEQSRAVAEVQAAVVVAQSCPRNMQQAIEQMRQSCTQMGLAERAFYRFPRAGQTISGASVHLARELARCFGNVQYGIAELSRDDIHGQSEVQAYAWDVQTNTRSAHIFVVPHKRDTKDGVKPLVDMRDIYENNANNGARRLREAIFSILPPWFVEDAKELCAKTLRDGGGKPMETRIADAIKAFSALDITVEQLETKIGRPTAKWSEHDVAQLVVTYKSLQQGTVTKDEEFPPPRVTEQEITGRKRRTAPPPPIDEGDELLPHEWTAEKAFRVLGVSDSGDQMRYVCEVVGRSVGSIDDLSEPEHRTLMQKLANWMMQEDLAGGDPS